MAFNQNLFTAVEETLRPIFGNHLKVQDFKPVGGGCINNGGRLLTQAGNFFIKYNDEQFEGMFDVEAKGLRLLKAAEAIHIPEVYCTGRTQDGMIFIVLEWIESKRRKNDFWQTFGAQLANMHRVSNDTFGLDTDNYIGSLPQYNNKHRNWPDFFREERIEPQIAIGRDNGKLSNSIIEQIRNIYPKLPDIFPEEQPALLHGDLWGGNFMVDQEGEPALIDPAVYYGHREMELAFTQMFGGFNREFYEAYDHHFPLEKGFDDRKALYNLYPVLVHVNLFGGAYLHELQEIISRFQ